MILRNVERRVSRRHAFTLMEVLVVVAILLVLASAASIAVFKYLEDSKKDRAALDIQTLSTAAKTYMLRNGGQPPEALENILQYVENGSQSSLTDPWNQRYQMAIQQDQSGGQLVE